MRIKTLMEKTENKRTVKINSRNINNLISKMITLKINETKDQDNHKNGNKMDLKYRVK